MKKIKIGLGLATAALMSITAVSAFAATEDNEKNTQDISMEVKTFEKGTMMTGSEGKILLNKEVLDESEGVEELSAELKTFEDGELETESEGKELMMKEIVK
ncbi:hypothetical protein ACIQ2D_11500 [Lysinibacillus sp. NPDC097287]|uniref:hypothetical protein n=1 Tax=Lysinibacillus sp. NPDC097287 TaxID=3364144 RepID=UPI003811549B